MGRHVEAPAHKKNPTARGSRVAGNINKGAPKTGKPVIPDQEQGRLR